MVIDIKALFEKLETEGLDYLRNYEQFEGTDLYPLARNYNEAKENLLKWLDENGWDAES